MSGVLVKEVKWSKFCTGINIILLKLDYTSCLSYFVV
jgi:hypothetical protein